MKKPKIEKTPKAEGEAPKRRGRPPNPDKAPKEAKAPKEPKAPKVARSAAIRAAAGDNSADPKLRQILLETLPKYLDSKAKIAKATNSHRAFLKDALRDGFTKADFELAAELSSPEGEKAYIERVANQMRIATYVGAAIGTQFSLLDLTDRTPIADRAYSEGERASMESKPCQPPYDPSTEASRKWIEGWQAHQSSMLKGGIKEKPAASVPVPSAAAMGLENDNDSSDDDFGDDDGEPEGDDGDDEFPDDAPDNVIRAFGQ